MRLGVHAPVAGGFLKALDYAAEHSCEVMQMLPYRRHGDPLKEDASSFIKKKELAGVKTLLLHSRFVPSLASSDEKRRGRSIELLSSELSLLAHWGADGYVLHAGAYSPGESGEKGLALAVEAIVQSAQAVRYGAPLYVENVPGGGRRLGGRLEELAAILDELQKRGVNALACLDTAHAWAAGYDLGNAEAMLRFLARVHKILGASNVGLFHLNDTRALLGSHREHHAHWGAGHLGLEGVRVLLDREEYSNCAGILELPPGPDLARSFSLLRGA